MSLSAAERPVVCFLGPETSYTHQAALQAFPSEKFELLPVVSIKDVFDTTQSGRASYGVVPFENSTNGSVVFTLDHFADREGRYQDLSVCAEVYLDVHHCLLGYAPSSSSSDSRVSPPVDEASKPGLKQPAKPLASLDHVKRVYSHPQAWGQVTRFMHTYLKGIETIDVSSTSRAAALAKEDESGTSAAISSALAGEIQGLEALARNIEDREDNTTRFFVLRKGTGQEGSVIPGLTGQVPQRRGIPQHAPEHEEGGGESKQPKTKSLVSFTVPHTAPGALADVLECFRKGGLNLTSINSRPSLSEPFQYVFFVEFDGHMFEDAEGKVQEVFRGVGRVAQSWRWLGSWVNMRA
ncbi:putative Prephenate dehydratase [Seiridium unicorne]|uniref:prephenate dehydratase n=1 Tax=Seiridium unicorne TaxID=138068 RepID=A0ABR2V9E1_9PEZI